MSDITDIVSRLRRTDENRGVAICSEAADTIEQLRKERDEARRLYCVMRDGEDGAEWRWLWENGKFFSQDIIRKEVHYSEPKEILFEGVS